jgi:hypothetical protein
MKNLIMAVAAAAVLAPALSEAQVQQRNPQRPLGGRRGNQQMPQDSMARRNRAALEGQIGQRMWMRMQNVLGLTDAQMTKVRDINGRYLARRELLNQQERDVRMALNDERIAADSTRQSQIADLMDRLIKSQRQRIDIMEQEQKELATVLTPLQRANYLGIEENIRRQVEEFRRQGGPGGMGGPGGRQGRMGPPPDGQPQGPPPDGMGPGGARRPLRVPPGGGPPPDGPPGTP